MSFGLPVNVNMGSKSGATYRTPLSSVAPSLTVIAPAMRGVGVGSGDATGEGDAVGEAAGPGEEFEPTPDDFGRNVYAASATTRTAATVASARSGMDIFGNLRPTPNRRRRCETVGSSMSTDSRRSRGATSGTSETKVRRSRSNGWRFMADDLPTSPLGGRPLRPRPAADGSRGGAGSAQSPAGSRAWPPLR